jgi:hypothetical protein
MQQRSLHMLNMLKPSTSVFLIVFYTSVLLLLSILQEGVPDEFEVVYVGSLSVDVDVMEQEVCGQAAASASRGLQRCSVCCVVLCCRVWSSNSINLLQVLSWSVCRNSTAAENTPQHCKVYCLCMLSAGLLMLAVWLLCRAVHVCCW